MPRINFPETSQAKFLEDTKKILDVTWQVLAKDLSISQRNLFDWRREKFKISQDVFYKCLELTKGKIELPKHEVIPDFWHIHEAARKGTLARLKKHGPVGTIEGRIKGGKISQERRRLYPEQYPGCVLPKIIVEPKKNTELAEFFGIMLGDGSISKDADRITITLHKEDSQEYITLVATMIRKLFSIEATLYRYGGTHKNVVRITVASNSLVNFLTRMGLKRGHKVKQQVGVPDWIRISQTFSKACLRGLMDTDGSVYSHRHTVLGHQYFNIGLNFSNASRPLLEFVYNTLVGLKFSPKIFGRGVNLYKKSEVVRYAQEVGFTNPYYKNRLNKFLVEKIPWRGRIAVLQRLGKPRPARGS